MYKVHFEVDVTGIAGVRRYERELYVKADNPKGARDKAESYIKNAYSEDFAILEVLTLSVIE